MTAQLDLFATPETQAAQPASRPGRCPHGLRLMEYCPQCEGATCVKCGESVAVRDGDEWEQGFDVCDHCAQDQYHARPPPPIPPTDPAVPAEAKPRLNRQAARILDRLREGPALNTELEACSGSRVAHSRVSDVRAYLQATERKTVSRAIPVDVAAGLYRYEIVPWTAAREGQG